MFNPIDRAEVTFHHIEEIGADGQNSRTYRSHDPQLDAEIVIKQLAKASMASPNDFFNESRMLYMSAHPNVCQVHYACHNQQHIFVAMPLYRRGSLKNWMSREYLTVREIIVAACQVISGLSNIHSKGLIHFDLKPDNILITDRGETIVADFGQAKQIDLNGYAHQPRLYVKDTPPEVLTGTAYDRRFDIYQLGLLLYRMCNGNEHYNSQFMAFVGAAGFDDNRFRHAVLAGQFPDRSSFLPHIPMSLRRVVQKCLAVNPDDRYPSAIAISNDLATISGTPLEWRYRKEADREVWEKNENGTSWSQTRNTDGSTVCIKTGPSGRPMRYNNGCKANMSDAQMRTFLGQN